METISMMLYEIEDKFGKEIADECREMKEGESKEFHVATYEGIIVKCVDDNVLWKSYEVTGEALMEEAMEMSYDMGMEM